MNGDIPPRLKKSAHEIILEFIRSRPPLNPVSSANAASNLSEDRFSVVSPSLKFTVLQVLVYAVLMSHQNFILATSYERLTWLSSTLNEVVKTIFYCQLFYEYTFTVDAKWCVWMLGNKMSLFHGQKRGESLTLVSMVIAVECLFVGSSCQVSARKLKPHPPRPRSLHERLLEDIKAERKLRPVSPDLIRRSRLGKLMMDIQTY